MKNIIPIAILVLVFMIFPLSGCQSQDLSGVAPPDPSEMSRVNENLDHSSENSTEEGSEQSLSVENPTQEGPESNPPAENPTEEGLETSTSPAAMDYYFMGSLYGLGDYPDFSTLYENPDAISRLKQFYADLNRMVDRVEYYPQSLEYVGTYMGNPKFSANGSVNGAGDDNQLHTQLKTLMIGKSEYDAFDDVIADGKNFDEDDFTVHAVTDRIPVLLGHDYIEVYSIGDELSLSLHAQPLQFTVIGFLQKNTTFHFDLEIPLDQHIVVPFYDIAYEPMDDVNKFYQERYCMQKCDGFVAIDATADAEQMFHDIGELAQKYDLLYAVTPVKIRVSEKLAVTHSI